MNSDSGRKVRVAKEDFEVLKDHFLDFIYRENPARERC